MPTSSPFSIRRLELMMILYPRSNVTTSATQLGAQEWLIYLQKFQDDTCGKLHWEYHQYKLTSYLVDKSSNQLIEPYLYNSRFSILTKHLNYVGTLRKTMIL